MPQMSDSTLKAICEGHLNNSLGWIGGLLSKERITAMSYYRGDLFGNEQDGRSKVVSRDVAESIDGAMPSLVKVFLSTDRVVICKPTRPDNEDAAEQATDYLNLMFRTQNNPFILLQTWLKSALLSKLGVVKSWWDDSEVVTVEEYEGLTKFQYLTLLSDPELEVMSVETRQPAPSEIDPNVPLPGSPLSDAAPIPGPMASPGAAPGPPPVPPPMGAPGPMQGPMTGPMPPQGPMNAGGLPQIPANVPGMGQGNGAPPLPQPPPGPPPFMPTPTQPNPGDDGELYDCKLKRTTRKGELKIEAIPPEEFLTERRAVSLADVSFCAHRQVMTVTDLIEMGVPKEKANVLPGGTELDFNTEIITRFKSEDESPMTYDTDALDPAMRKVWVAECYLKVDFNGDGIAEWRKVTLAGGGGYEIIDNDEVDGHPFSAWTPFLSPHKLYGESMADKTMDLQFTKSTVWRAAMDALYFNTAPQLVVVEGQTNLEDALTRRPGGLIRVKTQGAVDALPVIDTTGTAMQMMSFLDTVKESRTGIRSWSPGLEGNELNPLATTATGVNAVEDRTDDTLNLIARNFGEQGLVPLFKRMLKLICQHQDKAQTIRLRGQWVDIDPSTWDSDMDMEMAVGLGTGDKDKQTAQLMTLIMSVSASIAAMQAQFGAPQGPILTAENLYSQLDSLVESMGFKSSDKFFQNPKGAPPTAPRPDPKAAAIAAKTQSDLVKHQASIDADKQKSDTRVKADVLLAGVNARLDQEKAERYAQLKEWQATQDAARTQSQHVLGVVNKLLDMHMKTQAHQAQMESVSAKTAATKSNGADTGVSA